MTITEIRAKIKNYTEVGFTTSEAFSFLRDSLRERSRKSSKVADAIAEAQQKNGTYQYGWTGKEYGNRKWGKQ